MEIVPETEEVVQLADVAEHNFEELGIDVESPDRVVYGYAPRGNGCYFPESDTVFIGEEVLQRDDFSDLVVYEHENIHFEQYRRILGETSDNFHDLVNELNTEAFSTATNYFEDDQLIEELTNDQNLHFYNFKTILGLASEHQEFLEEIKSLKNRYDERRSKMSGIPVETIQQMHNSKIGSKAEEIAENYWEDILKTGEYQKFSPLIDRHDLNIRTDLLEAETQLWDIFRHGGLQNLPKQEEEFQPELTAYLDSLKSYENNEFYENGENVRPATENILEDFRERKHTENTPDIQIVADIINEGLENTEEKIIAP